MHRNTRTSSSRTLQFREIVDVTANTSGSLTYPASAAAALASRASVDSINNSTPAEKWRLVQELQHQSSLTSRQSSGTSNRSNNSRRRLFFGGNDDERSNFGETATVASTHSTRSWWPRRAVSNRNLEGPADDKSVSSIRSNVLSLFGSRRKQQTSFKLNQDRIISEFFDVQSVASDAKLHDRLNHERVVAKFFDVQSVQTETKRTAPRHRFSLFRRNRHREQCETKSVTSLGSIGIIFFHPNQMAPSGPVPDDETITLASGLLSSANFVIPEESESSSNGEELIEFQYYNENNLRPPTKLDKNGFASSNTATFLHEMASANTRQVLQDTIPRRPLKLPHAPERPSLADFDRWSSNSSVSSEPSVPPTAAAPKLPRRRRLSNGTSSTTPSRLLPPSDQEESKQEVEGEGHESSSSVLSLISDIVANYAAVKAEHDRLNRSLAPLKPCLKKEETEVSIDRPAYPVVFDSIEIRDYSRTVGDNPACSCGPPIALDWHVCSTQTYSVDHYESSIKPIKRTKKQFYLPARLRVNILMEDWQVPEDDLKRARREVTYIQYCRERSVATSSSSRSAQINAANGGMGNTNAPVIPGSPEGTGIRRKPKMIMACSNPDGADMPSPPPYRSPSPLEQHPEDPESFQPTVASSPMPLRKARSFSPPRVSPCSHKAHQELPIPLDALPSKEEAEEPEAVAPANNNTNNQDSNDYEEDGNETCKNNASERPEITPEVPKKRTVRKQLSCSNLSHTVLEDHPPKLPALAKITPAYKPHTFDLVRVSSDVFVPRRCLELLEL